MHHARTYIHVITIYTCTCITQRGVLTRVLQESQGLTMNALLYGY